MSGPCLSSSEAGRPLRPATRLRLGGPLPRQLADRPRTHLEASGLAVPNFSLPTTSGISPAFAELFRTSRQMIHVLRTLAPLLTPNIATGNQAFDLHVLSTPPAFVLSQNQTLRKNLEPVIIADSGQSLRRSSLKDRLFLTILACARARELKAGSSDLT